ncbi:MAG: spore coat protein [Clostridiales bacterium]|jgi:spore coat protein CotF|nr:spore coat protein [Clostridiales bacterium]
MSDKNKISTEDISIDVIQSQKSLLDLYCNGIKEASCKNLRDLLQSQLAECSQDQFLVFEWMSENGVYPLEYAEQQKVQKEKTKFCNLKEQMD